MKGLYFFVFLCAFSSPSFAKTIVDVTQTQVQVPEYPKRVVTLAPSLGELAADLVGADLERIVGVSEYTDYPPGLKKVPSVGPYTRFSLEKVMSLKPDLVLATSDGNSKEQVAHLRELGLPVIVVRTENFKEIEESIRLVASALDAASLGDRRISQLRSGLQKFRSRAKSHKPFKVLLQVGDQPLFVAGKLSFLQDTLETIGSVNVYGDKEAAYPRPSVEDVLHRNPDLIVVIALGRELKTYREMAQRWHQFPQLEAVKKHRVYVLRNDAIVRPTLRILEGLSHLEKMIYGKT